MKTIILLTISNIFMTFAWYGHLKYKASPLWMAIFVSWMIAFKDVKDKSPEILPEKINKGELGVKTNKGFYTYPEFIFKSKDWLRGF